uniref:Uncharacterized protein n=1 Tax=Molossus molossus TaxID=27622 RepID=A0A7J8HI05_MOLMO|nr:hypothetical protein HJG59_011077 [Molossus molossus]
MALVSDRRGANLTLPAKERVPHLPGPLGSPCRLPQSTSQFGWRIAGHTEPHARGALQPRPPLSATLKSVRRSLCPVSTIERWTQDGAKVSPGPHKSSSPGHLASRWSLLSPRKRPALRCAVSCRLTQPH